MSNSFQVNSWLSLARETEHNGIKMVLIGHWCDLAAYYKGSDGNAWCYHTSGRSWTNEGGLCDFLARINASKVRGHLIPVETDKPATLLDPQDYNAFPNGRWP